MVISMDLKRIEQILKVGETIAVEFKRCGNKVESDVYETVCSFLNRFGGDLFLGVLDNGMVSGVSQTVAPEMVKNFISCISNPLLFSPTVYLTPEIIQYDGKTIIYVHIPPSAEVHSYKKVIYDRVDDADVKVTTTGQIAQMYIRKQEIFTERRIYPYIEPSDLRLDLLPKLRILASNNCVQGHPWNGLSDEELLKSARLYGKNRMTGEEGYNLAAVMLLGKDDVILDVVPAYCTDALLRKENIERYDDREIIQTNLIESYERLMEFGRKHLPDKFFMEDDQRKSLRSIITREMMANTLIHREYTSSYQAKFVIENDKMYVENANRAVNDYSITPDNVEPNPKNPIIAAFFRNIGYAEQLGSGVRNLYKYCKYYSGEEPQFIEGDIFRIIVPFNTEYFKEMTLSGGDKTIANGDKIAVSGNKKAQSGDKLFISGDKKAQNGDKENVNVHRLLQLIENNANATQKYYAESMGISSRTVSRLFAELQKKGILKRQGSKRKGTWIINE